MPGRRRLAMAALPLALCCSVAAVDALADGRDTRGRALDARESGRVLPLESLIRDVDALIPGRLLDAELDDEDGVTVYELRWQLADGRRLEIEIDARTGVWRELKGPRLETVFRAPLKPSVPASGPAR